MRRQLSQEGKIAIFKSLGISKALIVSNVIEELKQLQKTFLRGDKRTKIRYDTLCNDFNEV